jgi:hypothetical protein
MRQMIVVLQEWTLCNLISVLKALKDVRRGSVEIFVQESKVVKIERHDS